MNRGNITRRIAGIAVCALALTLTLTAQNVDDLRKNKERAETQLRETNRALQKNLKNARSILNELDLINAEIKDRNKVIRRLNNEISALNRKQREMNDSIYLLQKELNAKKASYAKAIQGMGRRRTDYDALMFIFSAQSLNQSYRRMRYLKEYSRWRKREAAGILEQQQELKKKQQRLKEIVEERKQVVAERAEEADKLKLQQNEKRRFVSSLKNKEKSLRAEMKKQQSQIDALDRKIEAIIAEEARKAAERARAEAEAEARRLAEQKAKEQGLPQNGAEKPKETKPDTKPAIPEGYKMPRADRELSGSFAKNKGKLPFPVAGHYRIVGHFGLHKHPEFKYLDKNNLGIDIETLPGTKARAVFNGTVARVFSFGGATKALMIRHGEYYTVYTGLIEVYVKAGDKISAGQDLGLIYSDPQDNKRTRLSFQIRKESEKLDPEQWLNL